MNIWTFEVGSFIQNEIPILLASGDGKKRVVKMAKVASGDGKIVWLRHCLANIGLDT